MMVRARLTVLALAATVLVACASPTAGGGDTSPTASGGTSTSTDASSPSTNGTSTTAPDETSDATTDLVLAEQILSLGGAQGEGTDCTFDATTFVEPGETGVWIGQSSEATITMPYVVFLCLTGFSLGRVTVETTVAGKSYRTDVDIVETRPRLDDLSSETLFTHDGTLLSSGTDGIFQSDGWYFVPSDDVREALAAEGQVTVSAVQGSLQAQRVQTVDVAAGPYRFWLDTDPARLAVYGFPEGFRVPIGLYEFVARAKGGLETTYALVEQVGVVTMPRSRIAVFEVPENVVERALSSPELCITVPISEQRNCPTLPR